MAQITRVAHTHATLNVRVLCSLAFSFIQCEIYAHTLRTNKEWMVRQCHFRLCWSAIEILEKCYGYNEWLRQRWGARAHSWCFYPFRKTVIYRLEQPLGTMVDRATRTVVSTYTYKQPSIESTGKATAIRNMGGGGRKKGEKSSRDPLAVV